VNVLKFKLDVTVTLEVLVVSTFLCCNDQHIFLIKLFAPICDIVTNRCMILYPRYVINQLQGHLCIFQNTERLTGIGICFAAFTLVMRWKCVHSEPRLNV